MFAPVFTLRILLVCGMDHKANLPDQNTWKKKKKKKKEKKKKIKKKHLFLHGIALEEWIRTIN